MMDTQLDMAAFHALLCDEATEDQLVIALQKTMEIKDPESIISAIPVTMGVWSGWSL